MMNNFVVDFLGFRMMVSSLIIRIFYALGLLVITIYWLQQALGNLLMGLGIIILANLLWRIFCEALILLFGIHQELVKISRNFKS